MSRLIVGLGNPGLAYRKTRHNLGFEVVRAFAKEQGWEWKKERRFKGEVAHGMYGEEPLHLLLPMTYMNLSGEAIRKVIDYYKVDEVFVVVDDVYLKFGTLRLRSKGSSGGHNGLKSVEAHLGTQVYPRLKMGVGPLEGELPESGLEAYVLGKFTKGEQEGLAQVIEWGVKVISSYLSEGLEPAMQLAGERNGKEE